MPAFNFKNQFVEPIRAGTKNHTIRADQKDGTPRAKVGDLLHHYCGMRTKGCFRIVPAVTCTKVERITIDDLGSCDGIPYGRLIRVDENQLSHDECEQLARADGFLNLAAMMAFWDGRLPFKGSIIHWR